ncbi:MAG: enoyl-ACP reductase [Candidatus Caenarcaniphilales bacterium]|nr:enoyl-ACP reductase [Candidatus Caenarcaniphilales bacterium]
MTTTETLPETKDYKAQRTNILKGKKGVILGVANKWSIAWGIANSLHDAGAELVLTYQDRLKDRVEKLAEELGADIPAYECDVTNDDLLDSAFREIEMKFGGKLDFVIHSLAFAKKEELEGRYVDTSRDGYALAQDISAFSLAAVAKRAEPMLERNGGGSLVTLTYLGGERVVPNYNVMGIAKAALECSVKYLAADLGPKNIRVNAISAGPIKTLASSAISGISTMINQIGQVAPLRHNTEPEEVGDTALFLVSDLARGITGEIIHVDSGFHILGAAK